MMLFGGTFGLLRWYQSIVSGRAATAGTVMLSALPLILGLQLLLSALSYDLARTPQVVLHRLLHLQAAASGENRP
jgi:hypothetical protein